MGVGAVVHVLASVESVVGELAVELAWRMTVEVDLELLAFVFILGLRIALTVSRQDL